MVTSIVTTYSLCLRWHWHSHDFVTIDNNIIHNYKVYHIRNYYLFVHLRLKINNYNIGRTYFIFTMIIKVYYFLNKKLKLIIMTPYKKNNIFISYWFYIWSSCLIFFYKRCKYRCKRLCFTECLVVNCFYIWTF